MTIPIPKPGRLLAGIALAGILAGGAARLAGAGSLSEILWAVTTAMVLVPLALTVARDLWRRELGVDLIALLAMAGSLALGEYLAGAVIALMLSGGQALEAFAGARVRREAAVLDESALTGESKPVERSARELARSGSPSAPAASPSWSATAVDELPPDGDEPLLPDDLRDLRRTLYGLHAILRLHFAQEEEQYLPLLEEGTGRRGWSAKEAGSVHT